MNRFVVTVSVVSGLMVVSGFAAGAQDCGKPGTITVKSPDGKSKVQAPTRVFSDGSIAVRARLAVNPDGGAASYTVGDHGFTYAANGMGRWSAHLSTACDSDCGKDFVTAERKGFAAGTDTFCVFAMEVEALASGQAVQSCGGGRALIGDGLGRPKQGAELAAVSGGKTQAYLSTTSLKHMVLGQAKYLDSESLAIAVSPSPTLLGKVVWVGGGKYKPTLALIGDTGPAFGEGSIAMHQMLRYGEVSQQKPGPIPVAGRCGPEELALRPPFQSRPDGGKGDACRTGHKPSSLSDIRAYTGIDDRLDFVVLGKAQLERKGLTIQSEVSREALSAAAAQYTQERIEQMLACLPK